MVAGLDVPVFGVDGGEFSVEGKHRVRRDFLLFQGGSCGYYLEQRCHGIKPKIGAPLPGWIQGRMPDKCQYPPGFRFNGNENPVGKPVTIHDLSYPLLEILVYCIDDGATIREGRLKMLAILLYGRE